MKAWFCLFCQGLDSERAEQPEIVFEGLKGCSGNERAQALACCLDSQAVADKEIGELREALRTAYPAVFQQNNKAEVLPMPVLLCGQIEEEIRAHNLQCTAFTVKKNGVFQDRYIKCCHTTRLHLHLLPHASPECLQQGSSKGLCGKDLLIVALCR